jgi:Curlin associated repeat
MRRLPLIATILAAVTAAAPIAAIPANARSGGNVSLTIEPRGRDGEIVREGLQLYSFFKSLKNRNRSNTAKVDQRGQGNGAAIAQHGSGNAAEVFQRGKGHSATLEQTGNNNAFGIFQFGRNTKASVAQTGNGRSGLVIQGGW